LYEILSEAGQKDAYKLQRMMRLTSDDDVDNEEESDGSILLSRLKSLFENILQCN